MIYQASTVSKIQQDIITVREELKNPNYLVTLIKKVGGILQKSLFLEALEIVTCNWGKWVSKEDATISKQTFRVVLYSLRGPSGSGQLFDKRFLLWRL